jgi:Zn-finger nucleic acid-binding protein
MTGAGNEFQEIGHSGGQVIFNVVTEDDGRRKWNVSWHSSRPVPAALFGIYALPQGIPVGMIDMGGIGTPWNPPLFPGCIPVFISSDSQGLFGSECPRCRGYWRSRGHSRVCPYCGIVEQRHNFLTQAQRRYVCQYSRRLEDALSDEQDGSHVIDMDAVADATGKDGEKPPFYYAEEQQQNKFTCNACDAVNLDFS